MVGRNGTMGLRHGRHPVAANQAVVEAVEREFFIDNLLVRIHYIIVMIRWTGLVPS